MSLSIEDRLDKLLAKVNVTTMIGQASLTVIIILSGGRQEYGQSVRLGVVSVNTLHAGVTWVTEAHATTLWHGVKW